MPKKVPDNLASKSSIHKIIGTPEYRLYCLGSYEIQAYWYTSINEGDFLNLGDRNSQIASVSRRYLDNDSLIYEIYDSKLRVFLPKTHAEMISGLYVWLPMPFQLLASGLVDEYEELTIITQNIIRKQR